MNTSALLACLTLLLHLEGHKLTSKENEERMETCGKGLKLKPTYGRKILNGDMVRIVNAPWNVALEIKGKEVGLCSGTLISKRHILTARHCFAHLMEAGYYSVGTNQPLGGCASRNNDSLVVEGPHIKMYRVYSGVDCGYRKYCPIEGFAASQIEKVILPKVCDDKQLDFDDFAIVELSKNLKFSRKVQAVCVANNDSNLFDDAAQMKLYGFGLNPSDERRLIGLLRSETVKSRKCMTTTKKSFCIKSISANQLACAGDSGGGVVTMTDDRVTVVGVIFEGVKCETSTVNEQDYVSNVAYYSEDICKYTGICSRQEQVNRDTKLSTALNIVIPFFFDFLVLLSIMQ